MASLANKVIALTGAASGMGFCTAKLLASRGATLSLCDLSREGLEKVQKEIQAEHSTPVSIFTVDVRKQDQVDSWIAETIKQFGRLDGAANLAGVITRDMGSERGYIENQDFEQWDFVFDVNTKGLAFCMKAQLNVMKEGATVVNAASIAGLTGRATSGAYSASKHAVIGLTRSAAKEVGKRGIRVNCFCPGRIDTPMLRAAQTTAKNAGNAEQAQKELYNDISLRRMGQPEEVAAVVAFLLSDDASYISGVALSVDGGWAC